MILRAVVLSLALLPVAASAAAGATRPGVALTASPASVSVVGSDRRAIRVSNAGGEPLVVDVIRAGFALGVKGRPRMVLTRSARGAASWLTVQPSRLILQPGTAAYLTLVTAPPRRATPGDHPALVLLETRPVVATPVGVRMRIGITVLVRVPGVIRHRLVVRSLRIRRVGRMRVIELSIANTGNAVEWLRHDRMSLALVVRGRVVARLRPPPRELLPGSRALADVVYAGKARGPATARVVVARAKRANGTLRRSFRVRL